MIRPPRDATTMVRWLVAHLAACSDESDVNTDWIDVITHDGHGGLVVTGLPGVGRYRITVEEVDR